MVGPGQIFVKEQSCKAVFQGHPVCIQLQKKLVWIFVNSVAMPVRPRFWHWPGSKVQIAKGWAWTGSCFGQKQLSAGGGGGGDWPWPWSDRWSDPTGGQTAWFIALPCSHPPFLFLRDCNELGAVEQCNCIGNCMRASYYEGSRIVLRSTWCWVVNTYIDKVFKSNPAKYFDSVHFVVVWNSRDMPERQVLAIRPLVAVFLFMLIPPHPSDCRGILYLKEYWDLTWCWKKSGEGIPTTLSLLLLIMAMASLMASLADGWPGVLKRSHRLTTRD